MNGKQEQNVGRNWRLMIEKNEEREKTKNDGPNLIYIHCIYIYAVYIYIYIYIVYRYIM